MVLSPLKGWVFFCSWFGFLEIAWMVSFPLSNISDIRYLSPFLSNTSRNPQKPSKLVLVHLSFWDLYKKQSTSWETSTSPLKNGHVLRKSINFPTFPRMSPPEVGHWRVALLALPRRWWRWYSWLWNLGENNRWAMTKSRWWFQTFFIFTLTCGNDPIWQIFFKWVETTNQKKAELFSCFFGGWNRKPNFFWDYFINHY